ncbi:unnamed protein product, partial [Mesorhabditis belari]|uniref:Uncharacterized protein n=1 Tax=Mesorhabditis belari TaxID=2138241 RepID=A0AAF3EF90_9BILA
MDTSKLPTVPKEIESPKPKRRSIRGRRSSVQLKTPAIDEPEILEVSMKENVLETTHERLSTAFDVRKRISNYKNTLSQESAEWEALLQKLSKRSAKEKGKQINKEPLAENGCSDARPTRQARSHVMKLLSQMRSQDDSGLQLQENQKLENSCAKLNDDVLDEKDKIEQLSELLRNEANVDWSKDCAFWKQQLEWTEKAKGKLNDLAALLTIA